MINPDETVEINGVPTAIRDLPPVIASQFGYGHPPVYKLEKRQVLPGDWPYTPDTCLRADEAQGVWLDPEHLACPGCGLDCT